MLLTVSGDEICGPLPALLQAVAYHPPTVGLAAFSAIFFPYSLLFAPPPFSVALSAILPIPLCASFQFVVYCSVGFFLWGGQSTQRAMLVYPGEYHVMLGTHLFGLLNVS
jgi:hypothetical protein